MKKNLTSISFLLSTLCAAIALLINITIYWGPQEFFLKFFGITNNLTERVINPVSTIHVVFTLWVYIVMCFISYRVKSMDIKQTASIIALALLVVVSFVMPYFSIIVTRLATMKGVEYLSAYSALQTVGSYIQTPFMTLAMILFAVGVGTVMQNKATME